MDWTGMLKEVFLYSYWLYFTALPAGNLTPLFFRLCMSLSSLSPADILVHYGDLPSFF